jgi:tetratricopeptide (TPR) repeat protein
VVKSPTLVCLLCCFAVSLPLKSLSSSASANDLEQVIALVKQGNLKAAETRLKQAETESPNDAAIYRLLGVVYQRESKFVEAESALERAMTLSPKTDPQLLFLLCQTEFALKEQSKALRLANQISELAKTDPIAHYSLGQLLAANGRHDEAIRELEKAHTLAPGNPTITTELIIAYLDARREQPARNLMADFFKRASYDDLVQAGARFGDASQFDAAKQAFRLAIQAQPNAYDARFNLAFVYYSQGNLERALATLNQIDRHTAQGQWDYHYLRGKIDLALHQNQDAAAEMTKALQLQPGNESLCSEAGLLFFRFEDFWKALAVYQACAAQLPESAAIQTGLGLTYFRLGKYHDAMTTFRRVLAVKPDADAAREALGFLLYIEGSLKEARAVLEARAGAQDADYYIDYLNALVLLRLHPAGDHSDALRWLDETLRRNPRFAPAYFERARIWKGQNKPEKALADLGRATETDPHYAQPYYLIAQVDYKLGKKEEANEARQKFSELNNEREEKEQERQVQNQLLQSLR